MEDCPNKTKPKDMKKARRVRMQALTTIKTWDDSSSQEEAHHKGRRPQVFIELFAHLPHHGTLWTAFASWKKVKLKPSGGGCWQQAQTVGAGNRHKRCWVLAMGAGKSPLTLWDLTTVARASNAGAGIRVAGVDDGCP